jgi:S-adenosylmethionine:tRNA ribosyltransferase-isomerase
LQKICVVYKTQLIEFDFMDPKKIQIEDYTYDLPESRIAQYPLANRDQSKLLVYKNGQISSSVFSELDKILPDNSVLIVNDTKVIHARLVFYNSKNKAVEIFCLEPAGNTELNTAFQQTGKTVWKCFIGRAKKQFKEEVLTLKSGGYELQARKIEHTGDHFLVELSWTPPSLNFSEILEKFGKVPLPPYISRQADSADENRYQTVYAHVDGSVAAPTAGLHFTDEVFKKLEKKNISTLSLTLHVGAGTFMPVKTSSIGEHVMHEERIIVSKDFIEHILEQKDKPIVAVGTTSLRALESLYWIGTGISGNYIVPGDQLSLSQWQAYELMEKTNVSLEESFSSLKNYIDKNGLDYLEAHTQLLVAPGYQIKTSSALITNFHQPQSTLLLLVASFVGEDWKKIYDYALANDFRFLSYGDSSILFKRN